MKTCQIANTDLNVARIAYGCAELIAKDVDITRESIGLAARLIHTACDHGINLFDLAAMYKYGKAEAIFGEVLKQSPGLRNRIIIQSKCGAVLNPNRHQPGDAQFLIDCSAGSILSSVETSLRRIGTDHLDILLLHWPDILMQPEEVASAFDALHSAGKVRYFGVSNFNPGQIELLTPHVRQKLIINQIQLGLTHSPTCA